MIRPLMGLWVGLWYGIVAVPAHDELPKKLTPEERKELESKWRDVTIGAIKAYQAGNLSEATKASEEALRLARRLYNVKDYPHGHTNLATAMNNLAVLMRAQGKLAEAESLYKEALAIHQQLFKGHHPDVAASLNNLAGLYQARGRLAEAEPLYKEALAMRQQLYKEDHPAIATSLNNLASLYEAQGQIAKAQLLYKDALAMRKRLFPGDHPHVATSLNNLAGLYVSAGKFSEAAALYKEALAMRQRLYPGDHPDLATSLNNLAYVSNAQGKPSEAERLYKDALAMRKRLHTGNHPDVATSLNNLAELYRSQGRLAEAEALLQDALAIHQQFFPGDHPDVAISLNNLAGLYESGGQFTKAERLYQDALVMRQRLHRGDHPDVATSLNNLAVLYRSQGKLSEAEPLYQEALAMRKRLYPGNHPKVAASLHNLAALYKSQGRFAEAEPLFRDALALNQQLFPGDHPIVATCLDSLALLYQAQGKRAAAQPLHKDALAMRQRLYQDDHPAIVISLNNLAVLYHAQGEPTAAEPLYKDALAMVQRLYPGDHPHVAASLNNLGGLYHVQGQFAKAEPLYNDALRMVKRLYSFDHPEVASCLGNIASLYHQQGLLAKAEPLYVDALTMQKRLLEAYAKSKSEGDALNFANTQETTLSALLSLVRLQATRDNRFDARTAYSVLWSVKGTIARIYEQRLLQSRAAATDPALAQRVNDLAMARHRRSQLVYAPPTNDPATRKARETELKKLDDQIITLERDLAQRLPAIARREKLAAATLTDLQKVLPANTALVDYRRYTFFDWDETKPAGLKQLTSPRYVAFVVTRESVVWRDLDLASRIEPAVAAWRSAILSGHDIPSALPAKVRELVWEKVRKAIPANTQTVYLCPDADLCALPFAALPGDRPNSILLEDFAMATVPHPPFLLDQLWPPDTPTSQAVGALVVGGVKYDAVVTVDETGAQRGEPLLKPGGKPKWSFLPNTLGELNGIAAQAAKRAFPVTRYEGEKATTVAILESLPRVKFAHFATHGFFADPSFRGLFQLDDKDFQKSVLGERIGRMVNNPLLMTGLVFAGANAEKTPGRGILTGEQLIDRDLSGLELAVLSACETGLGELGAGGEGVFGLQRAFHYAGTRNVVASLWKVPDAPTAALMNLFYTNLWEKQLSPLESLRQAQLYLYRHPDDIAKLADGFRGKFQEVPGAGGVAAKPVGGRSHPLLWAGFSLSGTGR
jgi:tetratricopeptide (TPR) repeat protein/CHAT domain-containing protein